MAHDRLHRPGEEQEGEQRPAAAAPAPPVAAILALQRSAGNQATQQLIARQATPYPELKRMFEDAMAEFDFEHAAKYLNGFMESHIVELLKGVDVADLYELWYAADPYPTLAPLIVAEIEVRDTVASDAPVADAKAAPKAEAAADGGTPSFKYKNYDMSDKNVTLVKEKKDKKGTKTHAKIEESPKTYTEAILKKALGDSEAADWYTKFTSITFLGVSVPDIHHDLATHLKTVEKTLADQYGGAGKDPKAAGEALGLNEAMAGGRKHPTSAPISMHLFGLAIDVNYTANPFIGESANDVFKRAGMLVRRSDKAVYKSGMKYDELAALDKILEEYFACIDDDAKLTAALRDNENAPWKGLDNAKARARIEDDLKTVTTKWERRKAKGGADTDVIKKGGFMDHDKRLVDGIGLSWGGSYGDIMHFDMRNKGRGAKIQAAIGEYKAAKQAEAKKNAEEEAKAAE